MKKLLLCLFFTITAISVFGQQFSQYNTGSLYETFENPAQRAFIPDTTKRFAFNFLIPNFNYSFYLTGNAQEALTTRAFNSYYNTADLQVGKGRYNYLNANANMYTIMFKAYLSQDGNQEVGFFMNTKAEFRGAASDESIALFNGALNFPGNAYNNVFNDRFQYQVYNQIGVTYREQVTKRFAFGIKLSALSGIIYRKLQIDQSSITFDKPNDQASVYLSGSNQGNAWAPNYPGIRKAMPTFANPGAGVSIGTSYSDESGYNWQLNLKDLGFIHWSKYSITDHFAGYSTVSNLSTSGREDNITGVVDSVSSSNQTKGGFNTATNGLLELAINRNFFLDYDGNIKFSPTLIASKELFYSGFTAALVAPVQYKKYIVSLTATYNDLKLFTLGGQFMIKTYNSDFFIGSEKLYQMVRFSVNAAHSSSDPSQPQYTTPLHSFTGADLYIGASFKFGSIIESRMNESSTPDGDKGFIGRIWHKLFGKDDDVY